jgi:AcrR family transcriptional regulator
LCLTESVGKRQDTRGRIEAQIIESGRQQLSAEGAAGLSLRAIARDLGMVSSAVYRYVASRDELLTLLLVDAYSELADAVDAARAGAGEGWREQVAAIAHAGRAWAVAHPAGWALLYGSPVPGYHAPPEATVGPGTRVVGALFAAVAAGIAAGDVGITDIDMPRALSADFDRLRDEFDFPGDDAAVAKCFALWAGVVGAISLEVFGQYGADTLTDPAPIFDLQVRLWLDMLAD